MSTVRKARISGVPTMIVGGRYVIDGKMAGSNDQMLDVVDFLVRRIQAEARSADANP
mgnify:FL=1